MTAAAFPFPSWDAAAVSISLNRLMMVLRTGFSGGQSRCRPAELAAQAPRSGQTTILVTRFNRGFIASSMRRRGELNAMIALARIAIHTNVKPKPDQLAGWKASAVKR